MSLDHLMTGTYTPNLELCARLSGLKCDNKVGQMPSRRPIFPTLLASRLHRAARTLHATSTTVCYEVISLVNRDKSPGS